MKVGCWDWAGTPCPPPRRVPQLFVAQSPIQCILPFCSGAHGERWGCAGTVQLLLWGEAGAESMLLHLQVIYTDWRLVSAPRISQGDLGRRKHLLSVGPGSEMCVLAQHFGLKAVQCQGEQASAPLVVNRYGTLGLRATPVPACTSFPLTYHRSACAGVYMPGCSCPWPSAL